LIDDEEGFAETHRAAFELRGLTIDVAHSWADGLQLFEACAHELIIADYQLPDSDNGFKLLAAAKQHRPSTMLVLISGVLSSRVDDFLKGSRIIDAYYAKEDDLLDNLLVHVEDARGRVGRSADWRRLAAGWLNQDEASEAEIDEVDTLLRAELGA
jgi:ActR/RegA family two-component response regulator